MTNHGVSTDRNGTGSADTDLKRYYRYCAARTAVLIQHVDEMMLIASDDLTAQLLLRELRTELDISRLSSLHGASGARWPWERAA